MKYIKLFEHFNEETHIEDAKWIVISHLGEVEEVDIDPKYKVNNLLKLNRLEKRHFSELKKCEEHLKSEGFFLYLPPNRVPDDLIIVGVGESIKEWSINWLNTNFGNLEAIQKNDKIYYIDGKRKPLFYYYKKDQESKNGYYYISYYEIWSFFQSDFGLVYTEIQDLMTTWLRETYKLSELTPVKGSSTAVFVDRDI